MQVEISESEMRTLQRALAIAFVKAKRGMKQAQRDARSTVSGWAMEAGDYEALSAKLKSQTPTKVKT